MTHFRKQIRPHVNAELVAASNAQLAGDALLAFRHLERAHVLGQPSTAEHVRVHWRMFLWAMRQRSGRELRGQVLRLVGAATKTAFGLVPEGNTGGADVSPLAPMPIPPDLASIIQAARSTSGEKR